MNAPITIDSAKAYLASIIKDGITVIDATNAMDSGVPVVNVRFYFDNIDYGSRTETLTVWQQEDGSLYGEY